MAIREEQTANEILDETACRRLGINRTDGRCLDVIEREGPVSAGRLAEVSGLSSGAVTSVIDRLERAGYARRVPDPDDRRRVLVEITPRAQRVCDSIYEPLGNDAAEMLAEYSTEQLQMLRDFFTRGRELSMRHVERVRRSTERAGRAAS